MMAVEAKDVVIGKCYRVDFSNVTSPVDPHSATTDLRKRFPLWTDMDGKIVRVIGQGKVIQIPCFKFEVLPAPQGNNTNSSGEWALCSPSYFNELAKQPATVSHGLPPANNVCNCNIWVTGCTCGAMARERASKKQKATAKLSMQEEKGMLPPW